MVRNIRSVIVFICIAGPIFVASKHFEWDYRRSHRRQNHWPGTCKTGEYQSPINIDTSNTDKRRLLEKSLIVHGYQKNLAAELRNNGHTISINLRDPSTLKNIWVQDGGLSLSKNEFYSAHFHWGLRNDRGSEHTINGKAFPMEAHLVHWNKDIGKNFADAQKKMTGVSLEVLGVHFKIGKKNKKLDHIFQTIKGMQHNQTRSLVRTLKLKHLLPDNKHAFYRYKGSLTTPSKTGKNEVGGCHEIVKWTVFKEPIEISQYQLNLMRTATHRPKENVKKIEPIGDNYRETKSVNARSVLEVDILDNDILDNCEDDDCDPDDDDFTEGDEVDDKDEDEEEDDDDDHENDRKRRKKRQIEILHSIERVSLPILNIISSKPQTSNENSSIDNVILYDCQDDDCDPDDDDDDDDFDGEDDDDDDDDDDDFDGEDDDDDDESYQ